MGNLDMGNLVSDSLGRFAKERPSHTALILADSKGAIERLSYQLVFDLCRRVAQGLTEQDLPSGSPVFIQLGNSLDSILALFGSMASGLVAVPLSSSLGQAEVAVLAAQVRPGLFLGPEENCPDSVTQGPAISALQKSAVLNQLTDSHPNDPAFLLFTSGTSGRPRAVLHGHRVLASRQPIRQHWLGLNDDDVLLHAGDFNWSYTLGVGLLDPWAEGATAALYTGEKSPEIWPEVIVNSGATLFASVPALYRRLLKYADMRRLKEGRLRHCLSAGEVLSKNLLSSWEMRSGLPLYEALGMTECSTFISTGPEIPIKPGSPGQIQPDRQIAVLREGTSSLADANEVGELAIFRQELGLMLEYFEAEDSRKSSWREDWFITGDLVHLDDQGYVWHHGRSDEMINASGYRVSPQEVEQFLASHPLVAECAVTETEIKPDLRVLTAFIVKLDPAQRVDPQDIVEHMSSRLADYKCPRRYVFIKALPRSNNGKLLRRILTERYSIQATNPIAKPAAS